MGTAVPCPYNCKGMFSAKKTPRRKLGALKTIRKILKIEDQPNESISLLIVRFKSLSLRRSASILLIE